MMAYKYHVLVVVDLVAVVVARHESTSAGPERLSPPVERLLRRHSSPCSADPTAPEE